MIPLAFLGGLIAGGCGANEQTFSDSGGTRGTGGAEVTGGAPGTGDPLYSGGVVIDTGVQF